MGTSKYNLPKIDGKASVKIPRDFNALADAVDNSLSQEVSNLTTKIKDETGKLTNRAYKQKNLYLNFMDDDARSEFMTKIKPIFDEYGYKCSIAINASLIGTSGYMTWANIEQLASEGYEILNHGWTGASPHTLTLDQMKAFYELEKQAFLAHGLNTYDYYVYSGVQPLADAATKNRLKQVYKCSFANYNAPLNSVPFDNYEVRRYPIFSGAATKTEIDKYVKDKGVCILFGHAYMTEYTPESLRMTLDYLSGKGFTYISGKEIIDGFKNTVELGNAGGDYFYLDQNGNVDFSYKGDKLATLLEKKVFFATDIFSNKALTDYKENAITIEKYYNNIPSLWLPEGGTIKTHRHESTADNFAYQEYERIDTPEKWKRTWNVTKKKWNFWWPSYGVSVSTVNRPKFIKRGIQIYDYTLYKSIYSKNDGFTLPSSVLNRSTAYTVGSYAVPNATINIYECISAGTTSDVAPTLPTTEDATVVDGTVTWRFVGVKALWSDANGTSV